MVCWTTISVVFATTADRFNCPAPGSTSASSSPCSGFSRSATSARISFCTSGFSSALLVGTRSRRTSYLPMTSITTRAAFLSASVANTGLVAAGAGEPLEAPVMPLSMVVTMAVGLVRPRRDAAPDSTCTLTFLSSALGASRMTCFSRIGESPLLASSMIS